MNANICLCESRQEHIEIYGCLDIFQILMWYETPTIIDCIQLGNFCNQTNLITSVLPV